MKKMKLQLTLTSQEKNNLADNDICRLRTDFMTF